MSDAVRLYDKMVYSLSAKDFAKTANEMAKRNKKFALQILSEIKANRAVTQRDVVKIGNKNNPGTYDAAGNITEKGRNQYVSLLRSMFKLRSDDAAKKITVKQFIDKITKNANASNKIG